jgi:hypothetical protein
MPLQATSGAASYDAFGGGVPVVPAYIEEVFSTYLYAGNSSTQTITNGIDLAGKGGLVWTKARADRYHNLEDTVRGAGNSLWANVNSANYYYSDAITAFGSTGYTLGADNTGNQVNSSPANYVSWTFRKQPKFFDIVTFTGNSTANRNIAHSLGSVPGCVIVRDLLGGNWNVYHRSVGITKALALDVSDPAGISPNYWDAIPTSSVFTVGTDSQVNFSGHDYVAYIFAHDAGGFGLTGTDNVISCGTFTTTSGYSPNVELGYEPQWIMLKRTDASGNWLIVDTMRGWVDPAGTGANDANLRPDLSDAEATNDIGWPYATGFNAGYRGGAESTWIYVAIRKGPMKVPTDATKVFSPQLQTPTAGANNNMAANSGFPIDWLPTKKNETGNDWSQTSRLTNNYMTPNSAAAEGAYTFGFDRMSGVGGGTFGWDDLSTVSYAFRRAPKFFDVVCYTGTSVSGRTVTHNLNAEPEMIIVKRRDGSRDWTVSTTSLGWTKYIQLNMTTAPITQTDIWNNTSPTSSVFTLGDAGNTNFSGWTYVAYLFGTCAGVSKVGSYTGNGTTQTIDCGFGAGGARFVLIKRTDTTADWYVYDTARGMTVLTDPYVLFNSSAAQAATLGSVTTVSTGFALNSTILAAINVNAGTYIFLAIA